MNAALTLARRGLGRVWPNPAVGCILVSAGGEVLGRGWTQPSGRPHAETEALRRAGDAARGATAYVTLEPCSHRGNTGPCADALVAAGIARAVIAVEDPDPRVSGRGIERLKSAGIDTRVGVCRHDAERLNAGFLKCVTAGRPLVTLKIASTLDGRIATHARESKWITGPLARAWGHAFRASHDAIVTSATTVRDDDPELTCRLPGMEGVSPVRVALDSRLSMPLTSRIVATASQVPTWVVTTEGAERDRREAFTDCGVEIIEVDADDGGRADALGAMKALGERGITRVLVEGGSTIAATMFRAHLVDRIVWFRAPDVMGGDGLPVAQAFGVDELSMMASFARVRSIAAGRDMLELYERAARPSSAGGEG